MAWQDLCVLENEGHRDEKKNLDRCELVGCQEGAMQPKVWLDAEAHVCLECRAGTLPEKKQEKLLHLSRDFKILFCVEGIVGMRY